MEWPRLVDSGGSDVSNTRIAAVVSEGAAGGPPASAGWQLVDGFSPKTAPTMEWLPAARRCGGDASGGYRWRVSGTAPGPRSAAPSRRPDTRWIRSLPALSREAAPSSSPAGRAAGVALGEEEVRKRMSRTASLARWPERASDAPGRAVVAAAAALTGERSDFQGSGARPCRPPHMGRRSVPVELSAPQTATERGDDPSDLRPSDPTNSIRGAALDSDMCIAVPNVSGA
mmetsp:Transcript_33694/g.104011  ORF Transcript_33694/g.104011 Transcript_33694/m.104011 type:complete len:229 (-) Transcript_33694:59-745(-)